MERYQFTDAELMLLEQLPNPLAVYQFVGRQVYTLALSDGFREMFGYRLIDTGKPMYVNMKVTRMNGRNRLILGVSIIDAHMKQQEEEKRLRQEKESLGRIAALSPNYMVLYTVDPVTGKYTQYSPSSEFEKFGLASQGEDFFIDVVSDAPKAIAPKDMERHLRVMTRENMLRDIRNSGVFIHHYRMIMDGRIVPTSLKATLIKESNGEKIILGVTEDAE